ncbi:hypothetical protein [Streptomyces odontomachi]|uniref:hypothetical protein n=1 Tax=Streptomyces odontomachi TaxID=2944940 RepID=UPI00210C8D65|nr:hypothetical protein [Streptomyces sp. ODS25]
MEHMSPTTLAGVVSAAEQQGPGPLLRIVLVVLLVGAALMAWFLLRGYRDAGDPEDGGQEGPGGAGGGREEADSGKHHAGDRGGRDAG